MKKNKIISNYAPWIPLDKRISFPPRKPELRRPLLWLAREGDELFLVNESSEVLEEVIVEGGGFQTVDGEAYTVATNSRYFYQNVQPNQAVKVDEYDGFYDRDSVINVILHVTSSKLGRLRISSPAEKGGVKESILLWDTHEPGKYVGLSSFELEE